MSEFTFYDETERGQLWLRAFFMGPTGSGKSKGAIELASKMFEGLIPTTLINTERGRGRLYADRYKFSLVDLSGDDGSEIDFDPDRLVRAIDLAETRWPGNILVFDSATHEWAGSNAVLQQADRFGEWKTVRPKHNAFVDRLMAYQGHVIVTCRAKMKYEQVEEETPRGKKFVVNMLGVGPIQSDDLQYEFNVVGRFDQQTKDVTFSGHVDALQEVVTNLDDATEVAETLSKWLSEGTPIEPPEEADVELLDELVASWRIERGDSPAASRIIEETLAKARRLNRGKVHPEWATEQLAKSQGRIAEAAREAAAAK